jgi:hypothetical protein
LQRSPSAAAGERAQARRRVTEEFAGEADDQEHDGSVHVVAP